MEHCIQIKRLENEGDVVYHDAVASLFANGLPAIEVIKWKDVYDNMERCIDSCVAVRARARERGPQALLTRSTARRSP